MSPPPAPPTPADGPVDWIVAARPDAPGAAEALAAPRRVLFTGPGLAWLERAALLAPLRAAGADLALCSQSARDAGLTAEGTPPGVRWSSVATWMADSRPPCRGGPAVKSVVALWTAGPPGATGAAGHADVEFVRLAVAALAAGARVRAFDLRPAEERGAMDSAEAQRLFARLTESEAGVQQGPLGLREALAGCDTVLRLGAPGRTGRPAMFVVTSSWLRTATERELIEALGSAGQVVRG